MEFFRREYIAHFGDERKFDSWVNFDRPKDTDWMGFFCCTIIWNL